MTCPICPEIQHFASQARAGEGAAFDGVDAAGTVGDGGGVEGGGDGGVEGVEVG